MFNNTDIAFDRPNNNYKTINLDGKLIYLSKVENSDFYLFDYFLDCNKLIYKILEIFKSKYKVKNSLFCVGLGNIEIEADSLGCRVIKKIKTTKHLVDNFKDDLFSVCKITPNVLANTGIETALIIKGISNIVKPELVIVIDSLKTSSLDRLNKSIQITDYGIKPGSGMKNNRLELNYDTLGIPVISIGVPFVIDLYSISDIKNKDLIVSTANVSLIIEDISNEIAEGINLLQNNTNSS